MNVNIAVRCDTCETQTNCRLGMSNRRVQPFRFRCKSCGAPIDITMIPDFQNIDIDIQIKGATQIETKIFEKGINFVDLHLDFPVSFDEYVMGRTPFLSAVQRIGLESIQLHSMRINYLNDVYDHRKDIEDIFTLYVKGVNDLFKIKVLNFIGSNMACETEIDRNRALYFAIEKAFLPFSEPERNVNALKLFTQELEVIEQNNQAPLRQFIVEIINNGFLKSVQTDCLEIYPRILKMELIFRPALFLDLDRDYSGNQVPYRVSSHEFFDVKDLYKDILEIISRALVLMAGINNLKKRGSHNLFMQIPNTPENLDKFADLPLGRKLEFIDDNWYPIAGDVLDNHLRNSIAHYKAEYNEITQEIVYFPRREGMKQDRPESMYFLDFSRRMLLAFRELHRMNHLTKCLFVYYYLRMIGEKGTPFDF